MDDLRAKLTAHDPIKGMCQDCNALPKVPGRHKCVECAELKLPMDDQKLLALKAREAFTGERPSQAARAAKADEGYRWCPGCFRWRRRDSGRKYAMTMKAAKCRPCTSLANQRSEFGVVMTEQAKLLEISNGRCMICGNAARASALAVDHSHFSQDVRGLLCGKGGSSCNEIIGAWHDDAQRFLAAAVYLIAPPADAILNPQATLTDRQIAQQVFDLLKTVLAERHGVLPD